MLVEGFVIELIGSAIRFFALVRNFLDRFLFRHCYAFNTCTAAMRHNSVHGDM
jgi:hypothetical protein